MRRVGLIPVILIAAGVHRPAPQQTSGDVGHFVVTRAGAPFGTESFTITRQGGPDGGTYTLRGTRVLTNRQIVTALFTDSAGNPISYSRTVTGDSAIRISAGRNNGRLTVNSAGGGTHGSHDYQFRGGTLLLDDDQFHQFYLVCLIDRERSIPYVSPATGVADSAILVELAADQVILGDGSTLPARHFAFGSGAESREIWIDSSKRVLKVVIPGRQIVAIRGERPR